MKSWPVPKSNGRTSLQQRYPVWICPALPPKKFQPFIQVNFLWQQEDTMTFYDFFNGFETSTPPLLRGGTWRALVINRIQLNFTGSMAHSVLIFPGPRYIILTLGPWCVGWELSEQGRPSGTLWICSTPPATLCQKKEKEKEKRLCCIPVSHEMEMMA